MSVEMHKRNYFHTSELIFTEIAEVEGKISRKILSLHFGMVVVDLGSFPFQNNGSNIRENSQFAQNGKIMHLLINV